MTSLFAESEDPLVCTVAYDGLCTFEFGIAVELFGLPRPEFDRWYRFAVVTADAGPLRATGGVTIGAEHDLSLLTEANLVIVAGWRGADAPVPDNLCKALRHAHDRGARIASICSGVFVLAASGLLANRRATTHWRYAEELRERYPDIAVDPDVLFIADDNVFTSAGSAAGLDLGLHIIREDYGSYVANTVARRLVVPVQRDGGQRQFVPRPEPRARPGRIGLLIEQVQASLNEAWPLSRMALSAGMSSRSLQRRFAEEMGKNPNAWLIAERVDRARELIETSQATLAEIAEAVGFGSQETFRREFRRRVGLSPSQYRLRFGDRPRGQEACPARASPTA